MDQFYNIFIASCNIHYYIQEIISINNLPIWDIKKC